MTTEVVEKRRAVIHDLFAAVSAGDFATAVSLFTDKQPTYSFPAALGRDPCRGKDAIYALYEQMAARFVEPLKFTPKYVIIEGDLGVIEWDHAGLTRGGNAYRNSGVHVIEFAPDGRIQNIRAYLDSAPLTRLNTIEGRKG